MRGVRTSERSPARVAPVQPALDIVALRLRQPAVRPLGRRSRPLCYLVTSGGCGGRIPATTTVFPNSEIYVVLGVGGVSLRLGINRVERLASRRRSEGDSHIYVLGCFPVDSRFSVLVSFVIVLVIDKRLSCYVVRNL